MAVDIENLSSVKKLKKALVKEIPFVPNNSDSKNFLLGLELGQLIHIHDSWKQRMILPQPRRVHAAGYVRNDLLYIENKELIRHLRKQIEAGEDVNLYLSDAIRKASFKVENFRNTGTFNGSRDRMLVCEGFYHFHLAAYPQRTDEILIGIVRDDFVDFLGIFTHEIFKDINQSNSEMHNKYEKSINEYVQRKFPEGGVFIGGVGGGLQNMAGSSTSSSFNQIDKIRSITWIEVYCGGIEAFTRKLYCDLHSRNPQKVNPEWVIEHRSLIIYDRANKVKFDSNELRRKIRVTLPISGSHTP